MQIAKLGKRDRTMNPIATIDQANKELKLETNAATDGSQNIPDPNSKNFCQVENKIETYWKEQYDKKLKEYEKLILESKIEAKNYFNKAREKILKDVGKKKKSLEKEINDEISKAEKEILDLKNKSPEKIRKIAVETSSDLINQLIGIEVNNSSISAIVEDITRKAN